MKKIDILWLFEHIARELDLACVVKCLLQNQNDIKMEIRNIYLHTQKVIVQFEPKVIVYPFFYKSSDLAISDYIRRWSYVTHFNLAWEQIHYQAHFQIKAPKDSFVQKKVIHHAWGNFYRNYLVNHGVPQGHIFLNGNPVYQLYKKPYSKYFQNRTDLARKYNLKSNSRWIFIPENYRWAFIPDYKIDTFAKQGLKHSEILKMKEFGIKSIKLLLAWCKELGENNKVEIIFRPRPATKTEKIVDFYKDNFKNIPKNLHFIKDETVRDWILASDVVVSSISTSLIEAALANKAAYIAEPVPIPDCLYCIWYKCLDHLKNKNDFIDICLNKKANNSSKLKKWAEKMMYKNNKPIEGLATYINDLVRQKKRELEGSVLTDYINWLRLLIFRKSRNYFTYETHEKDIISQDEIEKRIVRWEKILLSKNG